MTTESAPLVPVVRGNKSKKRKPSFRPASKNKRNAAAKSASSKSGVRAGVATAKTKSTSSSMPKEKASSINVTNSKDGATSVLSVGEKATTTEKAQGKSQAKNVAASAAETTQKCTETPPLPPARISEVSKSQPSTASSKNQSGKKKRTQSTISIGSSRTIHESSFKPSTGVRFSQKQQKQRQHQNKEQQKQQQSPLSAEIDNTSKSASAQQQPSTTATPAAPGATTTSTTTTSGTITKTTTTTPVPTVQPGEVTLQSFCSKFRSKEKRPKTQPKQAAPPPPPVDDDENNNEQPAGPVVQVINGEIVLQESSMVIPPRKTVQEVEEEFQHVVEEEGHTTVVGASYNSFVSRRAPQHWTVEETKLFYTALRQVGTNFAIMGEFFKNRTRKQLKRKYQVEFSRHPDLIALALKPESRMPLEISRFNVTEEDVAAVKLPEGDPIIERVVEEPKQPTSQLKVQNGQQNNDGAYDEQNVIVEEGDDSSPTARADNSGNTGQGGFGGMFGGLGAASSLVEQAESLFAASEPMPPPQENNDDGFMEESFEEMQSEKTAAMSTISLVPTKKKTKAKRPKFKAARGRKRTK